VCISNIMGRVMRSPYVILDGNEGDLLALLPEIQALADSEREALGFLPARAFQDAIRRERLLAAVVGDHGGQKLVGYLLHSGVFPNAKVQQIAVMPKYRGSGVATTLLKALVAELERNGFMSIRADIASDLSSALSFYTSNGLEAVRERDGGRARGRRIIVHARQLDTENLFTTANSVTLANKNLTARGRGTGEVPVFAFDLNVFFDLVRKRDQSEHARRLFGQALGHTIRLAVADEFVVELQRTSKTPLADPVLQMALQLPRLPNVDISRLNDLSERIYEVAFVRPHAKGWGTKQAKSDAKHLAHAAISRATAFVTRDGPILNARSEILSTFGIDIATVEEVLDLLPESFGLGAATLHGGRFSLGTIDLSELCSHLQEMRVPTSVLEEFALSAPAAGFLQRHAIRSDKRVVGLGVVHIPKGVDSPARMLVHVRHENPDAELFADHLLSTLTRVASETAPILIELQHLPGQSIVNKLAITRGFHRDTGSGAFSKIAVGRPCSASTWSPVVRQLRRRTGLVLPDTMPTTTTGGQIEVKTANGAKLTISMSAIEDLLAPTLFIWPGRDGVIVPIARAYADELLGTAVQPNLSFIANRDASFLSLRGYVNSPRTAKLMRAGSPIIFYESGRTGNGRQAAVAVARIANSVVISKSLLDAKDDSRLVVGNVDQFSKSDDVLLTTFDNLMRFPRPVPYEILKQLNAAGRASLVSAVSLSSEEIDAVLTCGWSSEKNR
jgi:ribosomal protein S18 acetylase RimI-like enzyme/predicted nucleic acid-binding protein